MNEDSKAKSRPSAKLFIALVVAVVVVFAIVLALVIDNATSIGGPSTTSGTSYVSELETAMDGADADIGAGLIYEHECFTCHVLGDGSLSPLFDGIGALAADRLPPLSAAAYLYESTVDPSAFILEGYSDSMPNTYVESLTQQEIGHIVAYLLTLTE